MAIKDKRKKPYIDDRDTNIFIGLDLPIRKGDGKDVAHKDNNPLNSVAKNMRMESKKSNRSFKRTKNASRA